MSRVARTNAALGVASVVLAFAAMGCSSGSSSQGFEEPVRVIGGQFVEGCLRWR
jgi:hypothetical protein